MSDTSQNRGLSAVEAELYDRQIRLWGVESQEKLVIKLKSIKHNNNCNIFMLILSD